ncbi:MAG: metallophosphoesterase [Candidatus Sulfotelmatobacter sp.]
MCSQFTKVRGRNMVEYLTQVRSENINAVFFGRMRSERFDGFKSRIDPIIETLQISIVSLPNMQIYVMSRLISLASKLSFVLCLTLLFALAGCTKKSAAQTTVDLQAKVNVPFRFVAYGDTRFHDPKDTEAANPAVRVALVKAIAAADPSFICFTGDIVYNGYDTNDWKVWDSETAIWRKKNIPVYPALGNHDLHGNEKTALRNYFQRFPELRDSRYYAVRAANTLLLVLDSSQDETSGPQGQWLNAKLDKIPPDVDFVFIMLHHPPYTSSSDAKTFGGGHSSRSSEKKLAAMLEARQANTRARFVVFSGHVHNYERHEHGGVTYFVTGGGGAHAYPIERTPDDPFQSKQINYHYLLVEVDRGSLKITMHRLDLTSGTAVWTEPDSVTISSPATVKGAAQGN